MNKQFYNCLLWACLCLSSCKSTIFSENAEFKNTIITPAMHLEAISSNFFGSIGAVQILDSGFLFKWEFPYWLDDTVIITPDFRNEAIKDTFVADRYYVNAEVRSRLSRAYKQISAVESPSTAWDDKLYFLTEVSVKRHGISDTLFKYYYRWNDPKLKY